MRTTRGWTERSPTTRTANCYGPKGTGAMQSANYALLTKC